jgi:hypothetical protein
MSWKMWSAWELVAAIPKVKIAANSNGFFEPSAQALI